MISGEPLPEGHTARALADRLRQAGAPPGMIRRAERGYYHDYLSPLTFPEMALIGELRAVAAKSAPATRAELLAVAVEVIDGKHGASAEESDDWARSAEGRDAFRKLTGGQ